MREQLGPRDVEVLLPRDARLGPDALTDLTLQLPDTRVFLDREPAAMRGGLRRSVRDLVATVSYAQIAGDRIAAVLRFLDSNLHGGGEVDRALEALRAGELVAGLDARITSVEDGVVLGIDAVDAVMLLPAPPTVPAEGGA